MAAGHIASIGAALFSDLAFHNHTTDVTGAGDVAATWAAFFATEENTTPTSSTFSRITNVRSFPSIGTPANVVNVPVYGSKTSQQIQGQADLTSLEVTLNYVPDLWKATTQLGLKLGNGVAYAFRFSLLTADSTQVTAATKYASTSAGIGTVPHSIWYWRGKMDALLLTPSLTDATTATLTLTVTSPFYGPYTY